MPGYLSNEDRNPTGTEPMPLREFREEFLHNLAEFIRDDYGKFPSLYTESAMSSDICKTFVARITQYTTIYMNIPLSCGAMFRRYWAQDPNDDPLPLIGASHVTNNPIAYPPQGDPSARDPGEQISQFHSHPGFYSECSHASLATAREKRIKQQIQFAIRALRTDDFAPLYTGELPSAGPGGRTAGSRATSTDSHLGSTFTDNHLESTSRKRGREPSPHDENSFTIAKGPYCSKRVDTRTNKAKNSEKKHECKTCGLRFQFPARLKSHMETASHTNMRYHCQICDGGFTRHSSLVRHQSGDTACKGARRANGTSILDSSSGIPSVFHASAGGPSRTPYSAQDGIPLADSSAGPAPGNWQPLAPVFYPSSHTIPQTASGRDSAHAPSQLQDMTASQSPPSRPRAGSSANPAFGNWPPLVLDFCPSSPTGPQNTSRRNSAHAPSKSQDVVITQSPPSHPLEPIDSLMPDEFAEFINYDGCPSP